MAAAPEKAADLEWVHMLRQGGAFPFAETEFCPRTWSSPPGDNFAVRGPGYADTKAKVPARQPLLQLIAFDLIKSSSKISNIMEHPQCRVRAALRAARESAKPSAATTDCTTDGDAGVQEPFVWAFNLQLPSKENHSLVMYFVSFRAPEEGSLMQRFLDGDDAFRGDRLKMITNIPQAPQLVKLVVRERGSVSMIGRISPCEYRREKDYMEVDVDLGRSMVARTAFHVCSGLSVHVTTEFGFVFEGRSEDELPERIVGAIRIANLDFSCAKSIDCPLLISQVPERQKGSYIKGLWKLSLGKWPAAGWRDEPVATDVADNEEEKLCDGAQNQELSGNFEAAVRA